MVPPFNSMNRATTTRGSARIGMEPIRSLKSPFSATSNPDALQNAQGARSQALDRVDLHPAYGFQKFSDLAGLTIRNVGNPVDGALNFADQLQGSCRNNFKRFQICFAKWSQYKTITICRSAIPNGNHPESDRPRLNAEMLAQGNRSFMSTYQLP